MIESAQAWAERTAGGLPARWESRLLGRWHQRRKAHAGGFIEAIHAERDANIELRETVADLETVRIPLDASDADICQAADKLAARCLELCGATMHGAKLSIGEGGKWVTGEALAPMALLRTPPMMRAALGRVAMGQGIEPPIDNPGKSNHVDDGPAIARMTDAQWWRRKLRAVHAKHVEGAAIRLGYVNKKTDPYVSRESVIRRAQQNERNAASLEATTATNEEGQEFTLAELAAKGPANKAIRRAELMTRIAGFERIADNLGHVGLFFTMTCPSRMHRWKNTRDGRVIENPKYDGTLPNNAQKHLARTWARIRAAIARRGLHCYGFRIAEPNHDGTPHWHILVFLDPRYKGDRTRNAMGRFCALVRRYALATDGSEAGAKKHRCDFKPIDKGRGSAAGYIAKYVAKNIDGYRLDKDLIGNDAIETSHRVEAWASTWRIRQFQQIGGPPVGVWRELRRVKDLPSNAPANLIEAHRAANRQDVPEGVTDKQAIFEAGAKWDRYVKAQGGPTIGRRYAIKLETMQPEGQNKYGEEKAKVPMGVSALEHYTPAHMAHMGGRALRRIVVDSARYVWTITRKAVQSIRRVFNGAQRPWTCVNNCTGQTNDGNGTSAGYDAKTSVRGGDAIPGHPGALQNDGETVHRPHDGSHFGYQFGT